MNISNTRIRRVNRSRGKIHTNGAIRLSVHRTPQHIYAQVFAPGGATVLASASSLETEVSQNKPVEGGKIKVAELVGKLVAQRAKANGVTKVAFDRSGFKYHGRIKALANAARENGLEF